MTHDEIKTYTLRVSEANAFELIVILYDIILDDIEKARTAFDENNLTDYRNHLHHATRFMNELINSLNFKYELSYNLMSLYSYCNLRFASAAAASRPNDLLIIEEIIGKLKKSFRTLSVSDNSGPVMQNAQSVYAGLTYGKGFLNETYVDARDYNRGFNA